MARENLGVYSIVPLMSVASRFFVGFAIPGVNILVKLANPG